MIALQSVQSYAFRTNLMGHPLDRLKALLYLTDKLFN